MAVTKNNLVKAPQFLNDSTESHRKQALGQSPKNEASNDLAIIKTGGKQYVVTPGMRLEVEKLDKALGEEVVFDEVLLLSKNSEVSVGTPFIDGAKVIAISEGERRLKKVRIVKFKSKVRYHKTQGHRQTKSIVIIKSF